jgi:CRP/FNR family cyclic AMP-dependent transcriptional regulator
MTWAGGGAALARNCGLELPLEGYRFMPKTKGRRAFNAEAFLAKIGKGRTITKPGPGQVIFAQGDPANAVFYLQKGRLKVTVLSKSGREAAIGILGPGSFFGEGCLNGHPQRMTTARTMSDCTIMRLDKAAMIRVLHDEPKFSELFIAFLLHRNTRFEEDMVHLLFNSSEKRLARILLQLANFGKEGKPEPVIPIISQKILAEMVGTTRSRVNTFMNKFRRLGFIEYDGELKVHSSLLNVVLRD